MLQDLIKNSILSVSLLLSGLAAFSQKSAITFYPFFVPDPSEGVEYTIQGAYTESVKMEELRHAKRISDIAPGYPANWISRLAHVEVISTCHGKLMKAVSESDLLTEEQKKMMAMADANTNVAILITYTSIDPITKKSNPGKTTIVLTVVPDIEAEYSGGYVSLIKYVKEHLIRKLPKLLPGTFDKAVVKFTVDEKGDITDVRLSRTSGNAALDKLLVEEIHKLPKWKPAESAKGVKVRQEFEFNLYSRISGGC